jgi:hypothetical protein
VGENGNVSMSQDTAADIHTIHDIAKAKRKKTARE